MQQGEIIICKSTDNPDFEIEGRIDEETVWLNRLQLSILFERDVKTIGKHIGNALKEELKSIRLNIII